MGDKRSPSRPKRHVKTSPDEGFWDCSVCTFKNNAEAFKCSICDVRKGTSTRKPRLNSQLVAQQVAQRFAILPPPKKEKRDRSDKEPQDEDPDDEHFNMDHSDRLGVALLDLERPGTFSPGMGHPESWALTVEQHSGKKGSEKKKSDRLGLDKERPDKICADKGQFNQVCPDKEMIQRLDMDKIGQGDRFPDREPPDRVRTEKEPLQKVQDKERYDKCKVDKGINLTKKPSAKKNKPKYIQKSPASEGNSIKSGKSASKINNSPMSRPKLKNVDRSSGEQLAVTVGNVTVIITDFKEKTRSSSTSSSTITSSAGSDQQHQSTSSSRASTPKGDLSVGHDESY